MNCIAIEEKPQITNIIKQLGQKFDSLKFIGSYSDADNAISEIIKNKIDIVFIDIENINITSLEFIKSLPSPPLIIFTNHFSKQRYNKPKLNSILMQSGAISIDKFINVVNKTSVNQLKGDINLATINQIHDNIPSVFLNETIPTANRYDKYLFVKVDSSTVKVSYDEINFIEGLKDYIKIHIYEKSLITKSTIKHIESKLPADQFSRVHKSYIISIDKIDKIEYNHIFIGQDKIPIGMLFRDSFYERINCLRL